MEELKFGNFSLKKGEVNIQQQLDRFSLSTIKGDLEDEPFEIALSGDKNHPNILLNLGLKSSLLEKKFGIKINESKELCKTVKIKDYSNFGNSVEGKNKTILNKIKVAFGLQQPIEDTDIHTACQYGHLRIVKNYLANCDLKKERIGDIIDSAGMSPNREILKYVINFIGSNEQYKSKLEKYNSESFCEPTIHFTY